MERVTQNDMRSAITGLADTWIRRWHRCCDWCGVAFRASADLAAYVDFCMELPKLWPHERRGLPLPKVFCADCAAGAICELIDGVRYDAEVRA